VQEGQLTTETREADCVLEGKLESAERRAETKTGGQKLSFYRRSEVVEHQRIKFGVLWGVMRSLDCPDF
jgi:hypothetical protein